MKLVKVAAGVLNQTPLDWDRNRDNILDAIATARQSKAAILCLPELCITGYGCEDAFHSPGIQEMAIRVLMEIVPHTKGMIVSVGLPIFFRGGLFNTACLLADGKIVGFVGKQNLAGEGIHYEPRWFKAWPNNVCSEVQIEGKPYPVGDLMFEAEGVRFGFEICEDAWVAQRPGSELAVDGVDILLNPSASHFAFNKHQVRRRFVLDGSRAFNTVYVYSNLLGNEAGRAIYDGDAMVACCGKMLAMGPRLTFHEHHVTTAVVDLDDVRVSRARIASFKPDVADDANCISFQFDFPVHDSLEAASSQEPWEVSDSLKEEEFTRAVSLGLFDYMRKSYSRGFVVSLSGGADSAAVATLCYLAFAFASDHLGPAGLGEKLAYLGSDDWDLESLASQMITCVYQATKNSSDTTTNAARAVATSIGAQFMELDVDAIVDSYTGLVSQAIDRELTWEEDDLTLQNIQARVRGPSVWMLANIRNALLLSTSNRSEAAVGYATMDGDTCGGLSPIAGIDKAFLRTWLNWMETDGPLGIGKLPALNMVNAQQPTAELRPQSENQTDESDLMPYDLLDAIERAAIRDKQIPREVFVAMQAAYPQYDKTQLLTWIERFFRLWCRNQWKRERYAPSFHVDDKNLDPKTWCRFPIISGGFQRELRELREFVDGL